MIDDLERLLIERACLRLVSEYCQLVDHGEAARIADLFTDDGMWMSTEGRAALRQFFQSRQDDVARMSRHVCDNTLIDVVDADRARGVTYLTLYRNDGEPGRKVSPLHGPAMLGEYRDTFVRTPDGWRFERRDLIIDFVRAEPV
jgi:ketosteroid isomerase-like protein